MYTEFIVLDPNRSKSKKSYKMLEVCVYYKKGGINLINKSEYERGIYVCFQPETIHEDNDGFRSASYGLGSGFCVLVKELKRDNKKETARIALNVFAKKEELRKAYLEGDEDALVRIVSEAAQVTGNRL